ncbi:MAG: RagB/SusD family nutrient uptake outer membrane protein [Bacteroidales bacterium]|nr:RagB/SusD family nutrient uptake outer membrane protein [Bacteroidales bacterium]
MKTIYRTFTVAAALFTLAACNLDLYPSNSIVYNGEDPLIQTANDLETYRWANYAFFRSTLGGGYDIADDLMCDGFNATNNYGNNYGPIHRADKSFTSSDNDTESFWASNYSAIGNYNLMIAEVTKNTDPALRDGVKLIAAEAYFFRAFSYLRLARRFGPAYGDSADKDLCVPLVLVYNQQERPARKTVKEVYLQIYSDIQEALKVLGTVKGAQSSEVVTADVINALLANYYLDIKNYKEAYNVASKIIDSGTYSLCSNLTAFKAKYFEDGGENGDTESLMMLAASKSETPNGYGSAYTGYGKDPESPTQYSYRAYYLPSGRLVDAYNNINDYRYQAWFEFVNNKTPFISGGKPYYSSEFCVFVKYKGNEALSSSGLADGHVAPVPYSLGELHLIAAEAAFYNKDKTNALRRLTALQNKRNGNRTTTITEQAIQDEWFKETCGEGKRMECLKRWGVECPKRYAQPGALEASILVNTPESSYYERSLSKDAYQYTWPIPAYEIQVNPNLVQNIGY